MEHTYAGKAVALNPEGFFVDAAEWTPAIAIEVAAEAGIALGPDHWKVIEAARQDAASHGGEAPGLRRLTQLTGVQTKDLYRLFPKGPGKLAARIAGLPKPKACL